MTDHHEVALTTSAWVCWVEVVAEQSIPGPSGWWWPKQSSLVPGAYQWQEQSSAGPGGWWVVGGSGDHSKAAQVLEAWQWQE